MGDLNAFIESKTIPCTTDAAPEDSQRLRGLEGRTFDVHVVGWAYEPEQHNPEWHTSSLLVEVAWGSDGGD